jgi:hypothetical protein
MSCMSNSSCISEKPSCIADRILFKTITGRRASFEVGIDDSSSESVSMLATAQSIIILVTIHQSIWDWVDSRK